MKFLKTLAFSLVLTGSVITTIQPASADPLIWVMPSGCIGIDPFMQLTDPWPWKFNDSIYTFVDRRGIRYNQFVYRDKPYGPDEFVGAVHDPGHTTVWQAPAGAPNVLNRSLNCMLSNGASQG